MKTAIVAGAGIGGLATALALTQCGWTVTVLEKAPELAEVGAGLQISPNGMHVLQHLGITPAIEPCLFEPETLEIRLGTTGRRILRLPLKEYASQRWGARYIHIHRADLADALAQALEAAAPGAIRCGKAVETYTQTNTEVRVNTQDGGYFEAELLVGADGLHSPIRRQMLGDENPRFTGNVAWRALVPLDRFGDTPPPPTACIWAGNKRHAVTTRVRRGTLVNFVGMVERPQAGAEDWLITGDRAVALNDFSGWAPPVVTAIEQADSLNIWPLYDRSPLPRWSQGRVVLLGDAAHPMLPSLAQGAVQALEDAVVLANSVSGKAAVEDAVRSFYARRIERVSRVQRESARNVRRFHRLGTPFGTAFYAGMALAGGAAPTLLHNRNDWLFAENVALDDCSANI